MAHHIWSFVLFFVRGMFSMKRQPKRLSGGYFIDDLPGPRGPVTYGIYLRMGDFIKSNQ
jgi:hypothetical protein